MSLIWGIPYLFIRVAVEEVSPATLVFARTTVAAVILLPIALVRTDIRSVLERWRWVVRYNPMTYLVEIFRAPLYNGWLPGPKTLAFAVLAAVSSLVVGWFFYSAKVEEYGLRN